MLRVDLLMLPPEALKAKCLAVPACLSLFRIGDDGLLTFVRKVDIDIGNKNMFWMGIVDL